MHSFLWKRQSVCRGSSELKLEFSGGNKVAKNLLFGLVVQYRRIILAR